MNKKFKKIPAPVVRRLPRYLRYLITLHEDGVARISSNEIANIMEMTASQVRQDLSCFGELGQHGFGYKITDLIHVIKKNIGIDKPQNVIVIGAGRMGQALATYGKLGKYNFNILGIFDKNKEKVGKKVENLEVMDIENLGEFFANNKIDIGIICVSNNDGPMIADQLIKLGVKGIWNFSPVDIKGNEKVVTENVHITESLMVLSYKNREKQFIDDIAEKILSE